MGWRVGREREGMKGGRKEGGKNWKQLCVHMCICPYKCPPLLPFSPPLITGQETAAGKKVYLACGEVCGCHTKVFQRVEGHLCQKKLHAD